jgi:hypothetical protein
MNDSEFLKHILSPFDKVTSVEVKIPDGKTIRSSGVTLKAREQIQCSPEGVTWIAIFPGFSNVFCWQTNTNLFVPDDYNWHVDNANDNANIKYLRHVCTALRLRLISTEDGGYWEAVRLPLHLEDYLALDTLAYRPFADLGSTNLAENPTYQKGLLTSLQHLTFQLNYEDLRPDWTSVSFQHPPPPSPAPGNQPSDVLSRQWDTIVIKVTSLNPIENPSTLLSESISMQEVVYKENTPPARLMTPTIFSPYAKDLLVKTRSNLPGRQTLSPRIS